MGAQIINHSLLFSFLPSSFSLNICQVKDSTILCAEMDASALDMVMERQAAMRNAYNQHRREFQAGPSRGRAKTWAWGSLDGGDIQELVETTLNLEWGQQNREPDAYERKRRERHQQRVKKWVIAYLEDSGMCWNNNTTLFATQGNTVVGMPEGLALCLAHEIERPS
jgi:hypothetical protein